MATRTTVFLEDDLEGGDASGTYSFALDGTVYEIDLNDKNANALTQALAPFIEKARKVSGGKGGRRSTALGRPHRDAGSRERSGDIRAWAKQRGHKISERGRIPASIVAEYETATGNGARARQPA